ncbi:MAG: hypothetical protein M1833_002317 [Piccolia ochrophora]|nr:MAG: hypothetical protein M1833_002317 [Piccolia ochrophora]
MFARSNLAGAALIPCLAVLVSSLVAPLPGSLEPPVLLEPPQFDKVLPTCYQKDFLGREENFHTNRPDCSDAITDMCTKISKVETSARDRALPSIKNDCLVAGYVSKTASRLPTFDECVNTVTQGNFCVLDHPANPNDVNELATINSKGLQHGKEIKKKNTWLVDPTLPAYVLGPKKAFDYW